MERCGWVTVHGGDALCGGGGRGGEGRVKGGRWRIGRDGREGGREEGREGRKKGG